MSVPVVARDSVADEDKTKPAEELDSLEKRFWEEVRSVSDEQTLLKTKANYLGKKGLLASILRGLGSLSPEERPGVGVRANRLKEAFETACQETLERIRSSRRERELAAGSVDTTLPGRRVPIGALHPITQVLEEVTSIFSEIGFSVFEGPEVETDFYNFEALNIPEFHPAREMQDTFYLDHPSNLLLRTHTSPVQIRVMQRFRPPIRMIAPGVVYRRDSDVSHTPVFHQVEGLVVGKGIRFSDLKGTVAWFLNRFFGEKVPVRFRPSYFPFTEPSAEVDIGCQFCSGSEACRLCKGSRWLEVMGCGMVHPEVFRKVRYDPKSVTGFAFGVGVERLAMLKLEIPDIRLFFENDLRFLEQFR